MSPELRPSSFFEEKKTLLPSEKGPADGILEAAMLACILYCVLRMHEVGAAHALPGSQGGQTAMGRSAKQNKTNG